MLILCVALVVAGALIKPLLWDKVLRPLLVKLGWLV